MALNVYKLILCETSGHDTQYTRGFSTNINQHLKNRFAEAISNGSNLTYQSVATVAAEIVAPVTVAEGVANIPSGWNHPRYYFLLVVSRIKENTFTTSAGETFEVISGYTTHQMTNLRNMANGASNVVVDPALGFYVNNITRGSIIYFTDPQTGASVPNLTLQEIIQFTPNNGDVRQLSGLENMQFPEYSAAGFGCIPTEQYKLQTGQYAPTPELFYGPEYNTHLITPGYATRAAKVGADMGYGAATALNLHSGTQSPLQHFRSDSDQTSWLLRAVNASRFVDATMADNTAYNQVPSAGDYQLPPGTEPAMHEHDNSCFNELTKYTQYSMTGYITFAELEAKFPMISDLTDIVDLRGHGGKELVPADQGVTMDVAEPLCGSSLDVVTIISMIGSLTSMLSRAGVTHGTVHMTNHMANDDGRPYRVQFLEYVHILSQITGLSGDFRSSISMLTEEIRAFLMPALTIHNQIAVDCTVYFRMYRDTTVRMSYDGGRYRDYIIPQWCDGAISPTVTYDPTRNSRVGATLNALTSGLYAAEPKPY